jgi:hypothetical protein
MFRMALILLGSGIVSILLILFSSFSGSKRSDEAIAQIFKKRENKINNIENELVETIKENSPSIEKIEFLRELYPAGTILTLLDVTRGAKLLTDVKVCVTKVDDYGQIHCKLEEGDLLTLNPETDIFQLLNTLE